MAEKELFKIKMIKDTPGANDGFTTKLYRKGETYEINKSLYDSFIKMEAGEKVGAIRGAFNPVAEKKVVSPATEVKTPAKAKAEGAKDK